MKRQITISAISGAKNFKIENRLLTGPLPQPTDVYQTVQVKGEVFMEKLLSKPQFGLLPPNVRWLSEDGHSLIIEEAACYRNIMVRQAKQGELGAKVLTYTLPLPNLVYGISPDAAAQPYVSHLYVSTIDSLMNASYLFWLPLPNLFKTGAICTHTTINEHLDIPYHSMINRAISDFWNSIFNYDVDDYRASSGFAHFYRHCSTSFSFGSDYLKAWESFSFDRLAADVAFDRISHVGKLKGDLLAVNHTYSFGLGESERLMSNIVAISLENSLAT